MTDEKSDKPNPSEQVFELDPPGHSGEDATIVLANVDENLQTAYKEKTQSRALGTLICGRYRLEERIGSGGSSAVYLATDLSINRKVAIKLLLSGVHFSDEEILRFQREGRAIGALDHPHIVRIFEFNSTENYEPFLVMEYLQGKSLTEIVKDKGSLSHEEFIAYTRQVAQALSYAHKHGIVHRDVKSSNIVIVQKESGENIAKVVDFGLARPDDEAGKSLTLSGTILGSPYYMSPEQCRGERVDARSDIYSLGCVMYECLTGRIPFDGSSVLETFRMHSEEQPRPFAARMKNVRNAADIEKVVFKCLAKNPADRYQDAERLEHELNTLEKNLRSGMVVNTLSLLRRVRSIWSKSLNKHANVIAAGSLPIFILAGSLALRPQLLTDQTDKIWTETDLKAQHAFNEGDLEKANKYYTEALQFASFAPVTKRELRVKESLLGKLEIAYAKKDLEEKEDLKAQSTELENENVKSNNLKHNIAELQQAANDLRPVKDPKGTEAREREAVSILNSANDISEILIQDGHLLEASEMLQKVYDKTIDFIPDSDAAIPRSLLNLVAMFINTDPHKSFLYMTKSYSFLNEEKLPPLTKARFLSDLGGAHVLASQSEQGVDLLNQAIEIYRNENALSGISAGLAFLRLAEGEVRLGNAKQAAKDLSTAEQAFEFGEKNPTNMLHCQLVRSEIMLVNRQPEQALAILNKQIDEQEKMLPKRYQDLAEALYWKVRLLTKMPYGKDNASDVKNLSTRACAIWERTEHNAFAATMAITVGVYQSNHHNLVGAEESYAHAIELYSSMRSADHYSKVSILNNMGEILMRRSQFNRAYETLKKSEQELQKTNAAAIGSIIGIHPDAKKYLYEHLAECAERLGKHDEALKYREKVDSNF